MVEGLGVSRSGISIQFSGHWGALESVWVEIRQAVVEGEWVKVDLR